MATFTSFGIGSEDRSVMGTADQDYFLDGEGNVTTDEAQAAFLLVRKGQDVTKDMTDKHGDFVGKVAQEEAPEEAESSNKSKGTKTKGAK